MLAAMKVRGMAHLRLALAGDPGHALPRRRQRRRAPASRPARRRQPARRRVRRQRRARLEREPDPRCRRRQPRCARRAADRRRRHVRPARSRWPPANTFRSARSASSSSIRSGSSATSSTQYPEAEAQELALIYAAKGLRPERSVEARRRRSSPIPSMRSIRWRARSSGSIPTSSARRGARRSRRSCRSRAGALLPLAPFCSTSGPRALPRRDRRHRDRAVRRRRAAVALHRTRRAGARDCACSRWAGSPAPSPSGRAASRASRLADAQSARCGCKPGRDKSLRQRHPWIFSGAIAAVDGRAGTRRHRRRCISADGAFLARAAYSPASQIRARVWTFDARRRRSTPRSSRARRTRGRGARADARCAPHGRAG